MSTRYGFVSTYPPTLCGLASFTAALAAELSNGGMNDTIVRLVDTPQLDGGSNVNVEMVAGDRASFDVAVAALNRCDVAIVQHEFGIYGGVDGDEILQLLAALTVPNVVVLHTVMSEPTPHQREVLTAVVRAADSIVTMTQTAHDRLAVVYGLDVSNASVIPHGAPIARRSTSATFKSGRPTVLTWGLIGPGKGIEWAIEAMALLADLRPAPLYIVAGQTHPKVLAREGEAYRDGLVARVNALGLSESIQLQGHYLHAAALASLVEAADIILLPYDSTDQVTSGVLIEAIAAGKPVVATGFPHAVELLSDGPGLLVRHKDPHTIADALRRLLEDRELAAEVAHVAQAAKHELLWPAVAERYRLLCAQIISERVSA